MEIIIILATLLAIVAAKAIIKKIKQSKKEDKSEPVAPISAAPLPLIPFGRWAYKDDMVTSLDEDLGGDGNAPQDFVLMLATAMHFNSLPEFIVVSRNENGVSKGVVEQLLKLARLDIPVYQGGDSLKGVKSAGSDRIIEASKSGKFTLVTGSPVQDVAQALKDGAITTNLFMNSLLEGTSNKTYTAATRETANFVQSRLTINEVGAIRHRLLLSPIVGPYSNGTEFVERNRGVAAWDRANTPMIVAKNVRLNGTRFKTGQLRIADVIAVMEYFGVDSSDGNAMFSIMQHGLDLMKARQEWV